MSAKTRRPIAEELRGASRLIIDATTATTSAVQQVHDAITSGPAGLLRPLTRPAQQLTGLVYSTVRGVTRAVGFAIDQALAQLGPLLPDSAPGPERRAVIAALNGVVGDVLEQTSSPLAQPFELCRDGSALELDALSLKQTRLLVLVHGSAMGDLQWRRHGHDHGAALERDRGHAAIYARYNSGLHVSTNGHQLAAALERLVDAWPGELSEVSLLGFSMGGLVARSACHAGELAGHRWRRMLRTLVCAGTPHHGSPLERGGSWVETLLGVSAYSAPIGNLARLRSAGVTDLRFGNVLDAHWQHRDRFAFGADPRTPLPLPAGVRCFAIAASRSPRPCSSPRSDGLVPVASALGEHDAPHLRLAFPVEHRQVVWGAQHLDLLDRPEVYASLREWLD